MLPSPPSLLVLVILQGAPVETPTAVCGDSQRIELASAPTAEAWEICVSPGMMTGILFDTIPVSLELQDEVRFAEVLRGRRGISIVPPEDMMRGDRFRLTARLGTGAAQELVTFTLVAHPGQATRQVNVYHDRRPRESYQQEVEEERARNQQLLQENQQLRARLEQTRGLSSLIADGIVGYKGVQTLEFESDMPAQPDEPMSVIRIVTYRTEETVAAEVWLNNSSPEPWMTLRGSLLDANDNEVPGVRLRQDAAIAPNNRGHVILEVDAGRKSAQGHFKLKLWDEKSRVITTPELRFP
ncbi:DUF2381 family protein [Archangium lansingense]|uniref:DUF2381 family protein n=1 Tax=Archangium lansingense TaxID=2995310 RepID=UPI003B7E65B5